MKLTVSQKKTTPISKDLIGVFFEDINYGADGGIYAELIENRNFEFVDCYGDKGDYYTIFDGGYGWKAYNLNVGGVWMIDTYKQQFAQEVNTKGVDSLIASLAAKNRANAGR